MALDQLPLREKHFWRERGAHRLAAFEEQRELAHRHALSARALPRRDEAADFETLLEDAQPCAIVEQHLGSLAGLADEEEQMARERVLLHHVAGEREEAVVALAHVTGLGAHVDGDVARAADHASNRHRAASCSIVIVSTRRPLGPSTLKPSLLESALTI